MVDNKTDSDSDSSSKQDRPSPHLVRLFLLATVPPALIVVLDELAILNGMRHRWDESSLAILYLLYVFQAGVLTSIVGRFIRSWFLRWTILLWVLALVDLRLFVLVSGNSTDCLTYTLLSGQLSLLVFVALLGPGPWPWRLPSVAVVTVAVLYLLFGDYAWREAWSAVLLLQTLVSFPLFLLLLLLGFRIRPDEAGGNGDATNEPRHGFSFSIRHMLFWMLAAVPILTVGQRLSPFDLGYLDLITWFRLLFVAVCLNVVPLLVVVTVFADRRYVWPMIPLCILLTGAIGGLLTLTVNRSWVAPPALRRTWQDWLLADLTEIGSAWIAWTLLSAAFLAGLLLLFRSSGYRLRR